MLPGKARPQRVCYWTLSDGPDGHLSACLARIAPFADHLIVVAPPASVNAVTATIISEYGAQQVKVPSDCEARNVALTRLVCDHTQADWVVYIPLSVHFERNDCLRFNEWLDEQGPLATTATFRLEQSLSPSHNHTEITAVRRRTSRNVPIGAADFAIPGVQAKSGQTALGKQSFESVDVIMLAYSKTAEHYRMTCDAINSLHASNEQISFHVILVETCTEVELASISQGRGYPNATHTVFPNRDFNYNFFLQLGYMTLGTSTSPYILLANNDTVFSANFAAHLITALQTFDSVSPWCPGYHDALMETSAACVEGYRAGLEVCGWAIMFRREILAAVPFERLFPNDFEFWYQDNYYAHQLRVHGLRHALVHSASVHHLHERSHALVPKERYQEFTTGSRETFERMITQPSAAPVELSILVLSLPWRATLMQHVVSRLVTQATGLAVEVLVLIDDKRMSIGEKRNALRKIARGTYVSFVDDDDDVADDYISVLLSAIASNPNVDCITFNAQVTINGGSPLPCYYGLLTDDRNTGNAYYRRANHICCFRRDLATAVPFPSLNEGEDFAWAKDIARVARTTVHCDKTLYFYRFRDEVSESCGRAVPNLPTAPAAGASGIPATGSQRLIGFIHVATIGPWESTFQEQWQRIKLSGLYDTAEVFYVGIVGPTANDAVLSDPKLQIIYRDVDLVNGELKTLCALHRHAMHNDCNLLYIHTKGVSRNSANVTDWRHLMEYFVIVRFKECVAALEFSDICGVNWHSSPLPHFSGNFWWARSDYVRSLPPPQDIPSSFPELPRRWCEFWLGSLRKVRVTCLHESALDHYYVSYPRRMYARISDGTAAGRARLPKPWPIPGDSLIDVLESVEPLRTILDISTVNGDSTAWFAGILSETEIHVYHDPSNSLALELALAQLAERNPSRVHIHSGKLEQVICRRQLDIININAVPSTASHDAIYDYMHKYVRVGGCVLIHNIAEETNPCRKLFSALPGKKLEITDGNGVGVWYKQ